MTTSNKQTIKPSKIKSTKKLAKYFVSFFVIFLLVILSIGYYFLNTTSGLKRAINFANDYTEYHIKADNITGNLLSNATLKNFAISGNQLDFRSGEIELGWEPGLIFSRKVNINSIKVKDAEFILFPSTEDTTDTPYTPLDLSDINLPASLNIENITIENFVFKQAQKKDTPPPPPIFVIKRMEAAIDYTGQTGNIRRFVLDSPQMDAAVSGKITTKAVYPVTLNLAINYHHETYGKEALALKIDGGLKDKLSLSLKGNGFSDFVFDSQVQSLLNHPKFQGKLVVKKFDASHFGLPNSETTAEMNLNGHYGKTLALTGLGNIQHHSPKTDKVQLNFEADINDNSLNLSNITLGLLTAKQQLVGKGHFNTVSKVLNLELTSPALSWPQTITQPEWLAKSLRMTVKGQLDNYQLIASSDIDTQFAGNLPVNINAKGSTKQLHDIDGQVLVNERPLKLTGKIDWQPQLNYQLNLNAQDIHPIGQFPGIKKLDLIAQGNDKDYQANGSLSLYSPTIPPSDITLETSGNLQRLDTAALRINTLGGEILFDGQGDLSPLNLSARLLAKNIQPQTFYPDIKGNISGKLRLTARQNIESKQLMIASATIEQLTGRLQDAPITGQGTLTYREENKQLHIDNLLLDLAKNTLSADGSLGLSPSETNSNLVAKIQAKHLQALLPTLRGVLIADIHAKGSLTAPEIQANVSGKQLAYQSYHTKNLSAKAIVSLANDKIDIKATTEQVQVNKDIINHANIQVNGKLSAHQINAQINTPKSATLPSLTLNAEGGLSANNSQWKGTLKKLRLASHAIGQWQTQKSSQLILSADDIISEPLCLQQQSAQICANAKLIKKTGPINLSVKQLKTQTFSQFLPSNFKIQTTINGQANIHLLAGQPTVQGKFQAQGGKLSLHTDSGGLDAKIEQLTAQIALKNYRLESITDAQLEKLGHANIKAVIPDTRHNRVEGNIQIDNNSLAFLEELLPQVSQVKGNLDGKMHFAGNPSERLQLSGKITLHQTDFNVPQYGSEIRGLTLTVFAQNGNKIGFKGNANAGSGQLTINGSLDPAKQQGKINIKGKDFQIANAQKLKIQIDPDLQILFADHIKIRGKVTIPKALIVPESTGTKITASEDVVLPNKKIKKAPASSPIDAVITIVLGDDVRVASADIETRLSGKLNIIAKPQATPTAGGTIAIQTGELRIYGQNLNIKRGRIIFSHGPIANPALDIQAVRDIDSENVTVGANVLGTVKKPAISLFSTPSMPDSSILSYLLFGRPPNSNSFSSTALLQTGGLVGANTVARDIRSSVGLDVLDFSLNGMEAGKNLSKKLYVGMHSNFFDAINQFLVKYKLSHRTHVDGTFGSDGVSVDLIKTIETD